MYNELNDYDIYITDVYMLNYEGVLVFFQVCGTKKKSVFVIELATKKYKSNYLMLSKNMCPSKKPFFVLTNNVFTKSTYEVFPVDIGYGKYFLPFLVKYGDPLYKEAEKYVSTPAPGWVYAKRISVDEYVNKYWQIPKSLKIEMSKNKIYWA